MLGINFNSVTTPIEQVTIHKAEQVASQVFAHQATRAPRLNAEPITYYTQTTVTNVLPGYKKANAERFAQKAEARAKSESLVQNAVTEKAPSLWQRAKDKAQADIARTRTAFTGMKESLPKTGQILGPKAQEQLTSVTDKVRTELDNRVISPVQTAVTARIAEPLAQKQVKDAKRAATFAGQVDQFAQNFQARVQKNEWIGSSVKAPLTNASNRISQGATRFKEGAQRRVAAALPHTLEHKQAVAAEQARVEAQPLNRAKSLLTQGWQNIKDSWV